MSKSRGNFLDPHAMVAAFGADGARYVDAARGRRSTATPTCRWDSFVRRYNADLANDFGNLVNRTVSMVNRYLGGERPAPRPAGRLAARRGLGGHAAACTGSGSRAACSTTRSRSCGSSSAARTRRSTPSSRGRSTRRPRRATPRRPRGCAAVLGDLVEACRLVGLAVAPFMPAIAPRILEQLGHAYGVRGRRQRRPADPRARSRGAPTPGRGG